MRALTFDIFGTVVDWRGGVIAAGEALQRRTGVVADWGEVALAWRRGYEPAMQPIRASRRPFARIDVLHREILDAVLAERGIDLGEADRQWLNDAWHRLPAWPDVAAGLQRLRRRFVVAALSNGNVSLLVDLARHNDMAWDCVLSAENAQQYKPEPRVYETAAQLLGLAPKQIMMVAAHEQDLDGAREVGFATAFVPRPDEWGPGAGAEQPQRHPNVVADDFVQLAEAKDAPAT